MKKAFVIISLMFATLPAWGAFPTGWTRKCALTVNHTKVPSTQTSFPALIGFNITPSTESCLPIEMMQTGSGYTAQADGGDIRFTSDEAGTTGLNLEIATFTVAAATMNAKAELYVRIPTLSASADTVIYVWYGNTGQSQAAATEATWGSYGVWDSNYAGVWHLNEPTDAKNLDSTLNLNVSTPAASPTNSAGKLHKDLYFLNASSKYTEAGDKTSLKIAGAEITISCWLKMAASVPVYSGVVTKQVDQNSNSSYGIYTNNNNVWVIIVNAAGTDKTVGPADCSDRAYHYMVGRYLAGNVDLYNNNSRIGTGAAHSGNIKDTTVPFQIGRYNTSPRFFSGDIDEVRVSKIGRSNDWNTAEYNNQSDPASFWTVGSPSDVGGGAVAAVVNVIRRIIVVLNGE